MTIEQLEAMSLNDLKVMAYDTIGRLEAAKNDLGILNQLIAKKSQPAQPVEIPSEE